MFFGIVGVGDGGEVSYAVVDVGCDFVSGGMSAFRFNTRKRRSKRGFRYGIMLSPFWVIILA